MHTTTLALTADHRLPVVLPLVHEGGPLGPIVVVAQGLAGGSPVVSRSARFHFVKERSIVVGIDLARDCVGISCPADRTCVAGVCTDREIQPDAGGPAQPDAGVSPTPDSGSPSADAAVDHDAGAAVDAGPPDAGWPGCPERCGTCDQTCVERACECRDACGCALTCAGAGVDCEDIKCDGAGSACVVTATGSSNVAGKCEHEARCDVVALDVSNLRYECKSESSCDVSCTDVSNCRLQCTDGSACRLSCSRSPTCEYTRCDGVVTVCLDGSRVCNRDCP